jgi:large subunit ribosomal protein L24
MALSKIRKGDDVIVIAGRDKGKRGSVLRVYDDGRVLVDNVNVVKKHVRPNPGRGQTGGIIEKEAPLHVSNVAIFNPTSRKADRVGVKTLEDGRKVRYFKSDGEVVDVR